MTSDAPEQPPAPSSGSGLRNMLLVLALIYVLASVYFFVSFSKRTEALEQKQSQAMAQIEERLAKMEAHSRKPSANGWGSRRKSWNSARRTCARSNVLPKAASRSSRSSRSAA
jgi:hypothetical protein